MRRIRELSHLPWPVPSRRVRRDICSMDVRSTINGTEYEFEMDVCWSVRAYKAGKSQKLIEMRERQVS